MPDPTFNLSATPADAQPRLFVEPAPAPGTKAATNGRPGRKGKATVVGFEPPNLGKAIRLPVPDFNDPNRKATCLEVDFPIADLAPLAIPEGTSPGVRRRPEYNSLKWFARRGQSAFRAMLIAAGVEAPDDPTQAAKRVWDAFYANHQASGHFAKLKVLEPFMGGGTTVIEAARLGFDVTGVDLNPVAWFVTRSEVACSDPEQVKALFDHIEAEVKPQIQPFYTTTCPRGHKGRWLDTRKITRSADGREITPPDAVMPEAFDPIAFAPADRKWYSWRGPEIIYTFWAKHGPCKGSQGKPCAHRTPILKSPVIAEKRISTEFLPLDCPHCGCAFHAEMGESRMAPGCDRVVESTELPFTECTQAFANLFSAWSQLNSSEKRGRLNRLLATVGTEPGLRCPSCGQWAGQLVQRTLERHARSSKAGDIKRSDYGFESKPVYLCLVLNPKWLEGTPSTVGGITLGGFAGADPKASAAWHNARLESLSLLEVRGRVDLADDVGPANSTDEGGSPANAGTGDGEMVERHASGPSAGITLRDGSKLDISRGTVPGRSSFRCGSCGTKQDILEAMTSSGHAAPNAVYALQCHCPDCEADGYAYGGRFFKVPDASDVSKLVAADSEWAARCDDDLDGWWPRSPCWDAYMMRANGGVNLGWGYTHWSKMFNSRQLLLHSTLAKTITLEGARAWPLDVIEQVLGAFQQYLRNQCMFAFWHRANDVPVPHFSHDNYHPKQTTIENNFVGPMGYGNWSSCARGVLDAIESVRKPWESVAIDGETKAERVFPGDALQSDRIRLLCQSSTDLACVASNDIDLVITDPPFGNNLFYGDLADFFYVWLRLPLLRLYDGLPEQAYFVPERTPRATEAVDNSAEHPDDRDEHERDEFVTPQILDTVRELCGEGDLEVGSANPLFRRPPSSEFYCNALTAAWTEAHRTLKPGGILAFTFHHSADGPWIDVLKSLFDAGFILEATYPIHSDDVKGDTAGFGSKKLEYDIIHVCRKRLADPEPVSWAKMRRWVKDEGKRYRDLLERTHGNDLVPADLKIILIGKCLEFYSRHYGRVLTGDGEVLGVGEALLGVNQLLGDLVDEAAPGKRRPPEAEPLTRTVLSLFAERDSLTWDELSKTLRGTAIPPDMLIAKGWVRKHGTRVHVIPVQERYLALRQPGRTRKNVLKTDLDQAHFLIGLAMDGMDVVKDLTDATWMPKRSVEAILDWYAATGSDAVVREKAAVAGRLLSKWRSMPKTLAEAQMSLFTKLDEVV